MAKVRWVSGTVVWEEWVEWVRWVEWEVQDGWEEAGEQWRDQEAWEVGWTP